LSNGSWLAHRLYFVFGELLGVGINEIGELIEQSCTLSSRRSCPWLKSCSSSSDGSIEFCFAGAIDRANRLIGGGVKDL
jgi:hypothetical protein